MCCAVVKRGMPCLPNSHAIEVPSIRWSGRRYASPADLRF